MIICSGIFLQLILPSLDKGLNRPDSLTQPGPLFPCQDNRTISLLVAERYAEDIGLGGEVEQRLAKITEGLNQRADRLLGSLNIDGNRNRAEANLNGTVRLLELVAGPKLADDLCKRDLRLLDGE